MILGEILHARLDDLRMTATCRCDAVSRKLSKGMPESVNLCCWVCCDCDIHRYEEEWYEQLEVAA